jgi:hypothetical protein
VGIVVDAKPALPSCPLLRRLAPAAIPVAALLSASGHVGDRNGGAQMCQAKLDDENSAMVHYSFSEKLRNDRRCQGNSLRVPLN